MFKTREDELLLIKIKHHQMLKMFRDVLTRISKLKLDKLHVNASADFMGKEFRFDITVFGDDTNTSLSLYDFWEVSKSQELVDNFMAAIKTGDFKKVQEAIRR